MYLMWGSSSLKDIKGNSMSVNAPHAIMRGHGLRIACSHVVPVLLRPARKKLQALVRSCETLRVGPWTIRVWVLLCNDVAKCGEANLNQSVIARRCITGWGVKWGGTFDSSTSYYFECSLEASFARVCGAGVGGEGGVGG